MNLSELTYKYKDHPGVKKLTEHISQQPKTYVKGLSGSLDSVLAAGTVQIINVPHFFLLRDKEEAAYFYNDLQNLLSGREVHFFPSTFKRSIQFGQEDPTNIILRTGVLNAVRNSENSCIVSYPEAIIEKVVKKRELAKNTLEINKGENISSEFLNDMLFEYNFEQVDFVYEPGQFSVRGSIVDIFSFSDDHPYRIDFFGEEVESIRKFEVENQLSVQNLNKAVIQPKLQNEQTKESEWQSFYEFLESETVIW
ncbi:MAG: transcription-repair coupling factor, partial [Bacteroidales bacterium]|nr:transcription-repair coupling factor [Bacteroidales bacterium]